MDINHLPERVTKGILENAIVGCCQGNEIKNSLPYLAVSQSWRAAGQSIMFKDVFIKEMGEWDRYLASNLYLVGNGKYTKKLSITISCEYTGLVDILEPILVELNSRKPVIGWPTENISDHLLEDTFNTSLSYNSQILDDELARVMSECLQNVATRFPNITQLHIKISDGASINGQFVSQLIEIYKDQLTELCCDVNGPLEITHFPKSLIKLDYTYPKWGTSSIPIINSLTLRELSLNSSPDTWSWQKYCESPVFDNLESLSITTSTINELDPMGEVTEVRVDLPCLKRLSIHNNSLSENHPLKFGNIPQHLDKVDIEGNMEMLNEVSNLSVKTIGWSSVNLIDNEAPADMSEFHQVTSRLFKNGTRASFKSSKVLDIDFELAEWGNVRELALNSEYFNDILKVLINLPNLKQLTVNNMCQCNINKTLLKYLKRSRIEEFEVREVDAMDYYLEKKMEEFVVEIRNHLPQVKKSFFKITPYQKSILSRRALEYRMNLLDYPAPLPTDLMDLAFYYENEDVWQSYW